MTFLDRVFDVCINVLLISTALLCVVYGWLSVILFLQWMAR